MKFEILIITTSIAQLYQMRPQLILSQTMRILFLSLIISMNLILMLIILMKKKNELKSTILLQD